MINAILQHTATTEMSKEKDRVILSRMEKRLLM